MKLRKIITDLFMESLEARNQNLKKELTDETVLLESGLDSLGFAILVAQLEDKLNYDPFTLMEEPVYPRTFGDFVAVYEKYKDHAR
ncbi:acyl carrier protein [Candidatus Marithrix sp. Canyon 246]|uniref:acyl carrier protein n=1 Tax=Candidatus Marithrix sp. Canyon 246 TaxID=1827136 RepID=UPI00084A19C3|nr:acyl carrier protein [Candidatus Marithrix sp. Canyon 246]